MVECYPVRYRMICARRPLSIASTAITLVISSCTSTILIGFRPLTAAVEGQTYDETLDLGGMEADVWEIAEGQLPDGLGLDPESGRISGIAATAGEHPLTLRVSNGQGTLIVRTHLSVLERLVLDTGVASAQVGQYYDQILSIHGGVQPYNTIIVGLPAGLDHDPDTARVYGVPIHPLSNVPLEVTVTDSGEPQQTVTSQLYMNISPAMLQILTQALPTGAVSDAYQAVIEIDGGQSPFAWAVVDGILPEGLRLDLAAGGISGTPTEAGFFIITVEVTDSSAEAFTAVKEFELEIVP